MVKTKLPTNSARSSKRGYDGSWLEIIKKEELWVGNGYLSNERETKGKSNLMSHREYTSLHATILKLLRKRGKIETTRNKRLVSISLHFESKITMHWPFLMAFRATLKAWSSILHVWILTLKSNLGFFFIKGPRKRKNNSWKTSSRGCSRI